METNVLARRIKRKQVLRRQLNDTFCDVHGQFSPAKTIAVFGQITTLYYFGRYFEELISKPESLLIVVSFIIAPDLIKKLISMKYGANGDAKK